jgi:hypothetical protein
MQTSESSHTTTGLSPTEPVEDGDDLVEAEETIESVGLTVDQELAEDVDHHLGTSFRTRL